MKILNNLKTLIIDSNCSKPDSAAQLILQNLNPGKTLLAGSIEEALECLSSENFGLIILDCSVCDGESDKLSGFSYVPCIMLSEKEDEEGSCQQLFATQFRIIKDSNKNYIKLLPEAVRILFAACEKEALLRKLKSDLDNSFAEMHELKKTLGQLRTDNQDLEKTNIEINNAIEKAQSIAMEAELENMAKSDFLVRMSQKIRIPMNSIIGYADLLVETSCGNSFSSFAQKIKYGAERLLAELNIIVDFCKIEAGQVNIKEIEFDLELLVYDLINRTIEFIEDKNIEVMCRIAPDLPAVLKGDPQRIRQVLMNMLENSAVFTNEGRIELILDVAEETEDKVKVNFMVKDTGIGIKKKKLPKIFEAFKSTDDVTTKKFGGLGIGLSICQKIVLLLGGQISVESKFKEGSVFNFHTWFKKNAKQEHFKCRGISLEGRKILILENNKHTLEVLKQMAESFGMVVTAMTNGAEVLKIIEEAVQDKEPFELCIIDLELSDKDPFEIVSGIKKLNIFHPFMLALSNSVTDVVASCRNAGFNGFIPKPTNRKTLYNMLKSLACSRRENRKNDFITQYSIKESLKQSISVLYVCSDTHHAEAEVLKTMFNNSGYSAEIKTDVSDSLKSLKEKQVGFEIIFLDHQCPDYETVLKEAEHFDIPVVLVTEEKNVEPLSSVSGIKAFIAKPVTRPLIYEKVRTLVIEKIS